MKSILPWLTAAIFLGGTIFPVFSGNNEQTIAPWDTVLAKIQMIESLNQPDSVKSSLTVDLFDQYKIKNEDYIAFYERFRKEPHKAKLEFLNRVKTVLQGLMTLKDLEPAKRSAREKINTGNK